MQHDYLYDTALSVGGAIFDTGAEGAMIRNAIITSAEVKMPMACGENTPKPAPCVRRMTTNVAVRAAKMLLKAAAGSTRFE